MKAGVGFPVCIIITVLLGCAHAFDCARMDLALCCGIRLKIAVRILLCPQELYRLGKYLSEVRFTKGESLIKQVGICVL